MYLNKKYIFCFCKINIFFTIYKWIKAIYKQFDQALISIFCKSAD